MVHLDDLVALGAVGFGRGVLHIFDCVGFVNDLGQLEERGLKHGVDAGAQAELAADVDAVDCVELDVMLCDEAFDLAGQALLKLLCAPRAVEQEGAAVDEILNHVVLGDI